MRRQEGEQASGLGLGAGAAATARPWLSRAGGNPLQQLKMMQGAATSQLLSGASAPAARVGSDWQAARPLQAPRFASAQRQPAALQGVSGLHAAAPSASLRQFKFLSQSQPQAALPWSQPSQSFDLLPEHAATEALFEAGGSCPQAAEGLGQSQETSLLPSQTAQRLLHEISRRVHPAADDPALQAIMKKLETSDGKQQALQEAVDLVQGELAEQRARLETIQGTCKQLVQLLQSAVDRDDGLCSLADGATQTSPQPSSGRATSRSRQQTRGVPAVPHAAKLTSMLRVTHATAGGAKRKHDGCGLAGRQASPTKSGQSWDQQSCSSNLGGGSALPAAAAPTAGPGAQGTQRQAAAAQPEDDVARKVLKKMQRHREKLLQQQLIRTER